MGCNGRRCRRCHSRPHSLRCILRLLWAIPVCSTAVPSPCGTAMLGYAAATGITANLSEDTMMRAVTFPLIVTSLLLTGLLSSSLAQPAQPGATQPAPTQSAPTQAAPTQAAPTQAAPKRIGPCAQIAAACKQAGFVRNGAKTGLGIVVDCVRPIMVGTPPQAQGVRPLPQIDPQLVAACKQRNPNFGMPGGVKLQPNGQLTTRPSGN
jgi:hypothetical protein